MLLSSTSSPCLLSMTFSHVSTKHSLDSGHSGSFGNLVVSSNLCLTQARKFVVVFLISSSALMVYGFISSDRLFIACLYTGYIISREIRLNLLSPILQYSSVHGAARGTCCRIFFSPPWSTCLCLCLCSASLCCEDIVLDFLFLFS